MKKILTAFLVSVFILSNCNLYAKETGSGNGREKSHKENNGGNKDNLHKWKNKKDKDRKTNEISYKVLEINITGKSKKTKYPVERPRPEDPLKNLDSKKNLTRPKPLHPIERPRPKDPVVNIFIGYKQPVEKTPYTNDAHKNWGKLKKEEYFDDKNQEKVRREEIKAERVVRRHFRISGFQGDVDQTVNDYVNGRITSDDLREFGFDETAIWHVEKAVDQYDKALEKIGY